MYSTSGRVEGQVQASKRRGGGRAQESASVVGLWAGSAGALACSVRGAMA